jgi:hypothetical protein
LIFLLKKIQDELEGIKTIPNFAARFKIKVIYAYNSAVSTQRTAKPGQKE